MTCRCLLTIGRLTVHVSLSLRLSRAAAVGTHQRRRRHLAGPECGVGRRQRLQLAAHRSHQDRQVGHRASGRPQHLRLHAVHLSDGLHPGESLQNHVGPARMEAEALIISEGNAPVIFN